MITRHYLVPFAVIPVTLLASGVATASEFAQFRTHSITENMSTYQVHPLDVNSDGQVDIVATSPSAEVSNLYWYENPNWERHVLAENLKEITLWVTSADMAGDETPEIVALAGFSPQGPEVSTGELYYLQKPDDVYAPWKTTLIDRLILSHRAALADFDDNGSIELVVAPVTFGPAASLNVYDGLTPIVQYSGRDWKASTIREFHGHVHGLTPVDWDGDGVSDLLSAGLEGIWLHQAAESDDGPVWTSTQISKGKESDQPFARGTSDVRLGHLADGTRYIAAAEPWHSGDIFVYLESDGNWVRSQIEDSLDNSHALLTADLNGDGTDEIVAGNRTRDGGVYIYYADDARVGKWTRRTLDDSDMGGTDCNAADFNSDGLTDVVCGGHFSNNIRWYENLGNANAGEE